MNHFFHDASALAKRYMVETGTPVLNHLFHRVPRDRMACLLLGGLEVISILVRKKNAGQVPLTGYQQAMTNFRSEVLDAADFTKVTASDTLLDSAIPLLPQYSVNATDAVVLRSALNRADQLRAVGDHLVLVVSDQRLLKAAQAEGLATFDPETQDQAALDALLPP